jgi:hypothetical protein
MQTFIPLGEMLEPKRETLVEDFERCGIEKVMGDAVVERAKQRPGRLQWRAGPTCNVVNKSFQLVHHTEL